jgi:uncharacterized protein with HEPN domain
VSHPDRNGDYLRHILDAIDRIRTYTTGKNKDAFLSEPLLQDAVIRNIEVIGEAANRLTPEFIAAHNTIPWRDIAGMRHR